MRSAIRIILLSFLLFALCSGGNLQRNDAHGGTIDSAPIPDGNGPSSGVPGVTAAGPFPPDGAEGIRRDNLTLRWTPGTNAVGHNLYFGTDPNRLELLGAVQNPEAALSPLAHQTRYYWRIDETQSGGSAVEGHLWSFATSGLVAWWKLDESDGNDVADASGHGHAGMLAGDAKWQPAGGKIGGALELDGAGDFVDLGHKPAFDCANEVTVTAWIKVNRFDRRWQAIVTKGDTAWRLARDGGTVGIQFAVGYPEEERVVPGVIDVNDGEWHHVAGVHDGQRVYLYVDGQLDGSVYGPGEVHTNDYPVCIGENAQNRGRYWNGLIDDVRLYDCGLRQSQIKALIAGDTPITTVTKVSLRSAASPGKARATALVGWWKLDEGEGSEAADSSGNGFQGILLGNARWQPDGGKVAGALKLDGRGDCVEIGNERAFDITEEITVAAWIKVDQFDKQWQSVVTKGDDAWRLHRNGDGHTLAFHGNGIGTRPLGGGIEGSRAIDDGQWHHAVAVYDGSVASLYIDGQLDESVKISGRIQTNNYPVLIGENAQRTGREWNGMIDEVCIFQCALDAGAVGALCSGADPTLIAERAATARRTTAAADAESQRQDEMDGMGRPPTRRNRNLLAVLAVVALVSVVAGASLLIRQQ